VDAALERLRQGHATTETVEREIIKGDFVLLDMKSETAELNRTGFAILIRDEEGVNEWPYSGFSKELIGLKPQESKTIQHIFPENWEAETLRGKTAEMEVTIKVTRSMTLPDLDDEFAKLTNAGETLAELREAVTQDLAMRSQAEYDDKYFPDLLDRLREGATLKYHQNEIEHEVEHILEDLESHISRQNMDLETFFKLRETTREKYIEEEVKPVAKKRFEGSLIIDEIVRLEKIKPREAELNAEFENTFRALTQRGFDLKKIEGGKKGQQQVMQTIALESASRVMTRHALKTLKSIAIGEYKPFIEEETVGAEAQTEPAETEANPEQTESE
jgi:trigger factor